MNVFFRTVIVIAVLSAPQIVLASCGSLSDATISADCDNAFWVGGDLVVDPSVLVTSGVSSDAITVGASNVGTLDNKGSLTSSAFGLLNQFGNVTSIVNNGYMLSSDTLGTTSSFLSPIANIQSSIGSIVNTARHDMSGSAITGSDNSVLIVSSVLNVSANIGSVANMGNMSASSDIGSSTPISYWTFGIANTNLVGLTEGNSYIGEISNSGTLSAAGGLFSAAIKNGYMPRILFSSPGDALYSNTIGTIYNSGAMYSSGFYAGVGVVNGGIYPVTGTDVDLSQNNISLLENHSNISGESAFLGVGIWNGALVLSGSVSAGSVSQYLIENISNKYGATISGASTSGDGSGVGVGIFNMGTIGRIDNAGTIAGVNPLGVSYGLWNIGLVQELHNRDTGLIDGGVSNSAMGIAGRIVNLTNDGQITSSGSNFDVEDSANSYAIRNIGGATIVSLFNSDSGLITNGIGNGVGSRIDNITNLGLIQAGVGGYAIYNSGLIGTLVNQQGGVTPLTYAGVLPETYKIMISSPILYGKLAAVSISGVMGFGIATGSQVSIGTYRQVLTGIRAYNVSESMRSGTYSGLSYKLLLESGSDNVWDLIFAALGPSSFNTLSSIQENSKGLSSIFNQQVAAYQAALSYDCKIYDHNNLCVSVGGRYTYAGPSPSANQQAGLVILGYKPVQTFRVGAFVDQSINISTPSGFSQSKSSPMWGFFAKWHKNKDETGLGVQASAVTSASSLTATRPQLFNTEAGSGTTQFNGQGYQLTTNYHQPVTNNTSVVPYLGLRYTRVNAGAYTENSSATVTSPLSYNAMAQNTFSAIAGLGVRSHLAEKLTGTASVGIQQNLNYSMGNYAGSSNISGLESFSVQMPGNVNSMATASAGLYYDVRKNERVGLNVLWQQQPFIATNTTSALASYTIGF